ncbi:trans-aconitate 2-methyltransferase [Actibacterium sp.]|uniref:class I SAM-dependent methyltransferase n=1 Tax=Actibacterium sp. TaxID=1872125 RepID=UPI00356A49E1
MSNTTNQQHWDRVYGTRSEDQLTWFQDRPDLSLRLIAKHAPKGAVVDVGGGASRLVDALIAQGRPVSVVDLSLAALALSKTRLGDLAAKVDWQVADITTWQPAHRYDLWHDRAVFHFLTEDPARAAYVRTLLTALKPGGVAIIASFALDGPERCSNLPVQRYSPETLAIELSLHAPGQFHLIDSSHQTHTTPSGGQQNFQVSVFRRTPESL